MQKVTDLNLSTQYLISSKAAKAIQAFPFRRGHDDLTVMINTEKHISIAISLEMAEDWKQEVYDITSYDMALMDAVYTLMCNGHTVFPVDWIVKVMAGNIKMDVTDKKINAVIEGIKKLSQIRIKIDCTKEHNAFYREGNEPKDKVVYESFFLPAAEVDMQFVSNGKKGRGLKILETPAVYAYAEMTGQIINIPAALTCTRGILNDTDDVILIKRYVLKKVAGIVKENNIRNNKLSFYWYDRNAETDKGMFPALGYKWETLTRKKKCHIVGVVRSVLELLKEKGGITGYAEYRYGDSPNPSQPVMGFRIFYDRKITMFPT